MGTCVSRVDGDREGRVASVVDFPVLETLDEDALAHARHNLQVQSFRLTDGVARVTTAVTR